MSAFEPAFEFLMDAEDRGRTWKEVIDNNGGGVIGGINSKSYPDQYAEIKALPQADRGPAVASFYRANFWAPMRLGEIVSQDVASRVLDMGVNAGPSTAIRLLQESVYALPAHTNIAVDGHIGPATLTAVNICDADALEAAYRQMRCDYYREIVQRNPDNAKYLAGWLNRAER